MFQQILVLWDGSELAERALAVAVDLGNAYDAELTATCVVEPEVHHRHLHESAHGNQLPAARHIEQLFAQRPRPERERPCEFRVLHGEDISAVLLEHAYQHGFDLIVVGHHREARSRHLLPHGLADELVADAAMPVLVVSE